MIDEGPIGAAINRNLGGATAPGEQVEAEIDRFIAARHSRRVADEGERPALAAWAESEARYDARRSEAMRVARVEFHRGQAVRLRTVLEALVARHEEQARKLTQTERTYG